MQESFSICRDAVAQDFVVADGVLVCVAIVVTVAFYGVDDAVFDVDDDADVVGAAVLRAGPVLVVPVEEDDHSGDRFLVSVNPLIPLLEPGHSVIAACKLRDDSALYVAALVGAPGNEYGAPGNIS